MELENYIFLVSIAIILLTTKILGDVTNKVNMTQVVGAQYFIGHVAGH